MSIGTAFELVSKRTNEGVAIADINETFGEAAMSTIKEEFGQGKATFVLTDVTRPDQLENAFKSAISTWKYIDVVINNAGVMDDAHWERQIAINCTAVVHGSLLALRYMGKDHDGRGGIIVNLASILGFQLLPGCPIYVGTKHFVVGLDRSLGSSCHYERTGVKVLTMCPGVTDTPLIWEARRYALADFGPNIGEQLAKELGSLPNQPTEYIAKGLIVLLKNGKNGSCWIAEGKEPIYELEIPDRRNMRKY